MNGPELLNKISQQNGDRRLGRKLSTSHPAASPPTSGGSDYFNGAAGSPRRDRGRELSNPVPKPTPPKLKR
jgi:hypothetical protein